jgi:hypothetical protein
VNDGSQEGRGVMRVRTDLVLDQFVSRVLVRALELRTRELDPGNERALDEAPEPTALARIGYASRVAETEMFEPAREPIPWLADLLEERTADAPSRAEAIADLCRELAAEEPEGKPNLGEGSWRVPGPGGHVRHFLALAATDELTHGEGNGNPELTRKLSAGEAKRCFLYGFYARCCEEATAAPPSG